MKEKRQLKEMYHQVKVDLSKPRSSRIDVDKERDVSVSDQTCKSGDVGRLQAKGDYIKQGGVSGRWKTRCNSSI